MKELLAQTKEDFEIEKNVNVLGLPRTGTKFSSSLPHLPCFAKIYCWTASFATRKTRKELPVMFTSLELIINDNRCIL